MNENEPNGASKLLLARLLLALPMALVIFGLAAIATLVGFEVVYADRVYPGVHVQNIDLSGLTLDEANEKLSDALQFSQQGVIQFHAQGLSWTFTPAELGYRIDPSISAKQAYSVGRGGWFGANILQKVHAWFKGVLISPVVTYDERVALKVLQAIAEEVDQPVVEASLNLNNTDVSVISGQVGREVDLPATLAATANHLMQMENAQIALEVKETPPMIMDVDLQAEQARKILSAPLVLTAPDAEEDAISSWIIDPQDLAAMLTVYRVEDEQGQESSYQIGVNQELFYVYLSSLAPGLYVNPVNTRFIFNDDIRQLEVLEPAVIGRDLDVDASMEKINAELLKGTHEVPLTFTNFAPAVTDDAGDEDLGITELVQKYTSYFYGSEAARVQNIRAASSRFHGLLVAPGETFSMAQALGNISLDSGYAEAPIIYGDQTIQGIGGGVCQVSTTLFRTAFFGGFPINERHAHSYRVGYYEQLSNGARDTSLAGLDATVFVPIVDVKFTNDTGHWLLMETYVEGFSLTWKFYSTSDGRTIDWQTTGPTNVIKAPEPLYRENPDLPKGTIKQIDYSADGADVNVTRTVYRNDQVYFSDAFYTHYHPWRAIYEYGPGTEGIPEQKSD